MRKVEKELRAEVDMYKTAAQECFALYQEEVSENKRLNETISDLRMFFAKVADTDVIKYNGKLYRIASVTYYNDHAEETLDFTALPVREVN